VRYVSTEQSDDDNLRLIIGLSAGLGLLLIIIIIIMVIIIVVMCHKRRRRSKPTQELAATAYEDHNDTDVGFIELQEDDKYYSTIPAEVNDSDQHQYSRPLPTTPVSEDADHQYTDLKLPTPEPTTTPDSEPNSPYYLTLGENSPVILPEAEV